MALIVLGSLLLAFYARQRLFVRDPLAVVTRNGVKEDGAQVFINFSNDVLLENDNPPMYVSLVQQGRPVGMPSTLRCLHWLVCLTDAQPATLIAVDTHAHVESMTSRAVRYRDEDGREVVVTLR
jgi:hypothetical protein